MPPFIHYREILRTAAGRGTCAPTFECAWGSLDFFEGLFDACREANAPAILLVWPGFIKKFGFRPYVKFVEAMAEAHGIPAAMHIDHAKDPLDARAAIDAGFSSVMIDVEEYEFEEAIRRTRDIVEYAHARNALVEASFTSIGREHGGGAGDRPDETTRPEDAARFVKETGVDIFAPAVGNLHGCVGFTMPLDWNLVEAIGEAVPVPLALHGGSGLTIPDVARAARHGFRKLNLYTAMHHSYGEAVKKRICENPEDKWPKWAEAGRTAVRDVVKRYLAELQWADALSEIGGK